jgi:formylglycine-generating enzyme required for sulfatase activity
MGEALLKEAGAPDWAEILLFIDQFEELFTVVQPDERARLVAVLEAILASRRLRCIGTMRSDFYENCLELPALTNLLKDASYPLAAPTAAALYEMITRPAERAGLVWDDGLPGRILQDTGSESGALALMAYALDELYNHSQARDDRRLTEAAYHSIGGVHGAIGKRAEIVFEKLTLPDKERLLQRVFRELVAVDERGTATRQRARLDNFNPDELTLIRSFADARLLVTTSDSPLLERRAADSPLPDAHPSDSPLPEGEGPGVRAKSAEVEVAHEAVFRSWERLKNWISESQEDLILLRQMRAAADEWARKGKPDFLRWPAERLQPVYAMIERQQPNLSQTERDFMEAEQKRLWRELQNEATGGERRRDIGDRLAMIGTGDLPEFRGMDIKDGLPDIAWCPVKGGEIAIEKQRFEVKPFLIAKHLITYAQFETFLLSEDGFRNPEWWKDFPKEYRQQEMESQRSKLRYNPRDSVSWYQAVAFTRWLDYRYREAGRFEQVGTRHASSLPNARNFQLRLPTEWEWQWAAQNGTEAREYPWGKWAEGKANTSEVGLSQTTAVGMYPHGVAACGALDMAGNLWEWCLNNYGRIKDIYYSNKEYKVLRGGSWGLFQDSVRVSYRLNTPADYRYGRVGFRVVVVPLSRL